MRKVLLGMVVFVLLGFPAGSPAIDTTGGSVRVGTDDVAAGQADGTRDGYDFRFSYSPNNTNPDSSHGRYFLNGESQPVLYGYDSAIYSQSQTAPFEVQYYPVTPTATNVSSWAIWHFDFSGAGTDFDIIDQLQVKLRSTVADSPGSWILWEVGTDGISWDEIYSLSANQFNSLFWDITEYVQGSSEYFLKATLYSSNNLSDAALFKQNDSGLDTVVWLIPEPATMLCLAACGLAGTLLRKKRLAR